MHYFLLVLGQEYGHHLLPVRELLSPVLVNEVLLDVLLHALLVLFDYELLERVVQYPLEYPLLQYLEVRERALFQQKLEQIPDRLVAAVNHKPVDSVQEGTSLLVACLDGESLEVFHDAEAALNIKPHFLQGQVGFQEFGV